MSKFTAGYWSAFMQGGNWFVETESQTIAHIDTANPNDANLIAAAPDMYEALTACLHYIEHSITVKNQVRAAIAKAEGAQ